MSQYLYSELPPNHKALVELIKLIKVGSIVDLGDTVAITYTNRDEVLIVEVDENVQSDPYQSDRKP